MEDDRDCLVVIIADYADDIDQFLESNEGMKSRFSRTIPFKPYSSIELVKIFEMMVEDGA